MRTIVPCLALAFGLVACQDREITVSDHDAQFAVALARPVYQVTGGGSIVREDIAGAPREVYGFQAWVDAAGRVTGEAEVHFPSDVVKMHIVVQCLVLEGNRAWLSGAVTRSDDPLTPVGRVFFWQVQDNGEGRGAPPDRISNFVHRPTNNYPADICRQKLTVPTFPWDNGNVQILTPGGPSLADLVGTWDATVYYMVNPDVPADTVRMQDFGVRARYTVAPDGRYSLIYWTPGMLLEFTTGVVDIVNGQLVSWNDADPEVVIYDHIRVTGRTVAIEGDVADGYDWDGNGDDDPSHVVVELRRKQTGILVNDVAGTWNATVFRWRSVSDPTLVMDLIGSGGYYTMALGLDSRGISSTPGGTETGVVLFDGDRMLTRNGVSRAFTFAVTGDTWSFTGLFPYDFHGDGTPDPATLEVVLARR